MLAGKGLGSHSSLTPRLRRGELYTMIPTGSREHTTNELLSSTCPFSDYLPWNEQLHRNSEFTVSSRIYVPLFFIWTRKRDAPFYLLGEEERKPYSGTNTLIWLCSLCISVSFVVPSWANNQKGRARVLHRPVLKFPFCFNFTLVLFSFFLVVMVAHYIRPVAPSPFLFFCIIHTCILTRSFPFLSLFPIIRLL